MRTETEFSVFLINRPGVLASVTSALAKAKVKKDWQMRIAPIENKKVVELNAQALTAYSTGELKKAVRLWEKALTLDPRHQWIRKNMERVNAQLAITED